MRKLNRRHSKKRFELLLLGLLGLGLLGFLLGALFPQIFPFFKAQLLGSSTVQSQSSSQPGWVPSSGNGTSGFQSNGDVPLNFSINTKVTPPTPTCTRPSIPTSCPAGQSLATKSSSDACGAYQYSVCETSAPVVSPMKGAAPAAFVYCFDDPISQMSDRDWGLICDAKKRGIITGTGRDGKTYFSPLQLINRAEAAKILTVGVLKSLKKLSDKDFTTMEATLKAGAKANRQISYSDLRYGARGDTPWFASFVQLASRAEIVSGYPDGSYKPDKKINNAEAYKIIIETFRVASADMEKLLLDATDKTKRMTEWYRKYAKVLELASIRYSEDYGALISRKDFVRIVMELLSI